MTTPYKITPIWAGCTVAVLGAGPSVSQEVADSIRAQGHKCIALNHTVALAPWADMLVALDPGPSFCAALPGFAGLRICGVDDPDTDALYCGTWWETVVMSPHETIDIRNNGLAAIRIAARLGAAKLLLCGFDPAHRGYHTGALSEVEAAHMHADDEPYRGLTKGLAALVAELRAQGVEVEFYGVPAVTAAPVLRNRSSHG